VQHREETRYKLYRSFANLNTVATIPCECRIRSLDVYNDEYFMLRTACWLRKSLWQKIIKNLLLL